MSDKTTIIDKRETLETAFGDAPIGCYLLWEGELFQKVSHDGTRNVESGILFILHGDTRVQLVHVEIHIIRNLTLGDLQQ
jgi:hypothetical protein